MKMLSSLRLSIPQPVNTNFICHHHLRPNKTSSLLSAPSNPLSSTLKFRLAAVKEEKAGHQIQLPEGLEPEFIPKHVAVIMDGNRRWAKHRGLPPLEGHRAGREAFRKLARICDQYGVKVLTVFAFSTENWGRPEDEVKGLMEVFEDTAISDFAEYMLNGWRVVVIGNRDALPLSLGKIISKVEELTKENMGLKLVMAVNDGGRYDITEATKKIATKVKDGVMELQDIDETIFEQHLLTHGIEFPNPDLLIRTSGEMRVSNFLLWQMANTQLFFSHKLFPDLDNEDFVQALTAYQQANTHHH